MAEYIDRSHLLKALSVFNDLVNGNEHFLNGIKTAKEIIESEAVVNVESIAKCNNCLFAYSCDDKVR